MKQATTTNTITQLHCEACDDTSRLTIAACGGGATGDVFLCERHYVEHASDCEICEPTRPYTDDTPATTGVQVCQCGHPVSEHDPNLGTCSQWPQCDCETCSVGPDDRANAPTTGVTHCEHGNDARYAQDGQRLPCLPDCAAAPTTRVHTATLRELREMLDIIVTNARMIPDPAMQGATDIYAVPLDDIDNAEELLKKGSQQ